MTKSKVTQRTEPGVLHMVLGDGTPQKALATALVVGSALTLINHGDQLFGGEFPPAWKVLLTYFTPYCVTTWGAVTGKRAQWKLDFAPGRADRRQKPEHDHES
ncbi:nitrate/nitrite transporter NrtS [Parasedimentitalea psychrophila]|uniref:Nitrate/nitrite transporter NrtS n=1 Tax=Parasedimentitalea psychrophila TaxID=2997337 RepID=A0A9Y2P7T8_9RHOB|nr:nitrate/nitrite transporter NrtS [Parasedimentitalea psychrophila]WIY26373.1 nitrate/nitrite transporter NrtS [Parasedimentitalea psychrophila]